MGDRFDEKKLSWLSLCLVWFLGSNFIEWEIEISAESCNTTDLSSVEGGGMWGARKFKNFNFEIKNFFYKILATGLIWF